MNALRSQNGASKAIEMHSTSAEESTKISSQKRKIRRSTIKLGRHHLSPWTTQ